MKFRIIENIKTAGREGPLYGKLNVEPNFFKNCKLARENTTKMSELVNSQIKRRQITRDNSYCPVNECIQKMTYYNSS